MRSELRCFKHLLVLLVALSLLVSAGVLAMSAAGERAVVVVEVEGIITVGQLNYISRQVEDAVRQDAQLVVVVLNTPGGLVDATMEINRLFLNAPIPIAVLVAPSGAIAASAGTFIVLSADIAAMAPGTTIGAAHPVALTPDGSAAADEKTTMFLAKHLRSIAEEKGRPEDIAEMFVTENLTLNAREALEMGVIEHLVSDLGALLTELDGLEIEKQGQIYALSTAEPPLQREEMNLRERFQNWLSDPQIAFMLLMLGIMGIYFGLGMPGTFVPEIIGAILLVMGIYGIGLFDTNTTGISLLLLGTGLIVAEIFTAGFGVFGIGGAICLVAGAILLPLEPLMAPDWYASFRTMAIGMIIGVTIVTLFIAHKVVHSRRQWKEGSAHFKPPARGVVLTELNPEGRIKARGELWKARSHDGTAIAVGTEVEVVRAETLTLWVRPLSK